MIKSVKSERSASIKAIIYGVQGVGKSTFMAAAPSPVFLDFEEGTSDLDTRVDLLDPAPSTWTETLAALEALATEEHPWKSVCIDSLDWLENLCVDHICKRHKVASLTDGKVFGYGKGHAILFEEWRNLIFAFQKLSRRGLNVLCSAHSKIKTYNDPLGASFDRYSMKLTQNNQCDIAGYTQEWAQCVLFAHYDTVVGKVDERNVGLKGNTRIVHTVRADAYDAKNRYGLPEKIPLDWAAFAASVKAATPEDPIVVSSRILAIKSDETTQKHITHCNGDSRKLSQLENYLLTQKKKEIENGSVA